MRTVALWSSALVQRFQMLTSEPAYLNAASVLLHEDGGITALLYGLLTFMYIRSFVCLFSQSDRAYPY